MLAAGDPGGLAIELVQYTERVSRPLPAGYRICDQGLLNVAFGSRSAEACETTVARVRADGYRLHDELPIGSARVRYVVGTDDLSVELLTIPTNKSNKSSCSRRRRSPMARSRVDGLGVGSSPPGDSVAGQTARRARMSLPRAARGPYVL